MNNFESCSECGNHFWAVFFIQLVYAVVACDNEMSMLESDGAAFGFSRASVTVAPDLEKVTEARVIVIV